MVDALADGNGNWRFGCSTVVGLDRDRTGIQNEGLFTEDPSHISYTSAVCIRR
jgi:hypothetical protein